MNYHPENDMTEDEQAYWEAKAEEAGKGSGASPCSPDVVSWDRWKQTLDERDEARREIDRVKRLGRMLDDSPKSLLNHLVSWANGPEHTTPTEGEP